jgi:hypothetical protein
LIERLGTGVDGYDRTDAVWLPHAPVAINRDFDFATAMTLDIGAGIAAQKRKRENEQVAAQLSGLALDDSMRARLDELRACGVHAYVLLWGPSDAVDLRIAADRFAAGGKLTAHVVLQRGTRPLDGDGSWSLDALRQTIRQALAELPRALAPYPPLRVSMHARRLGQ